MISKLLIIDVSAGEYLVQTLNVLKAHEVHVLKYDFSKGFVNAETGKLTFVEEIKSFVREYAQVDTVKLTDVCVVNPQKKPSNTPSPMYNNSPYVLDNDGENTASELAKWDYLASTMKHLNLGALVQHLDFIDVNHLLQDKPYQITLDYVNSRVKETVQEEGVCVNWLSHELDVAVGSDELLNSTNWLHAICTTFYSGVVKTVVDKYFKLNNTVLEVISSIPLEVDIVEEHIVEEYDGDIKYLLNETVGQSDELITNIILYDLDLKQSVEEVRNALLPNTMIVTFGQENTYEELQNILKELQNTDGFNIIHVALFQRNYSNLNEYTFLTEEQSIIESVETSDPDLYTWQKFIDFVIFLDNELNVSFFDLMMCNIYSDENWKYVINYISNETPIGNLGIRSSEDVTGHSALDGDWVLESPEVDVNLVGLYFSQSIEDVKIKLDVVDLGFTPSTKDELKTAVNAWCADATSAASTYGHISTWDTVNITNMVDLFKAKKNFNDDINDWNVSNVTTMEQVFWAANAFNQPLDKWDVSNVVNFGRMFDYAWSFNQDITGWDVSNSTYFIRMFNHASVFNQNISDWLIQPTANLQYMFSGTTNTFVQVLDGQNWIDHIGDQGNTFTTTSGIIFSHQLTHGVALTNEVLKEAAQQWSLQSETISGMIGAPNEWNVSDVTNFDGLFRSTTFNEPIDDWDTSKVTSMKNMFYYCRTFNQPISSWDVSKVETMSGAFSYYTVFNQDITGWDVSSVKDFSSMFLNRAQFNQPINSWDVSNATNMKGMFDNYEGKFNQPLYSWDVSNVTSMQNMFSGNYNNFNQDITGWNVVSVTSFKSMFHNNGSFNQDISPWLIKHDATLEYMFHSAGKFGYILNGPNWLAHTGNQNGAFTSNSGIAVSIDASPGDALTSEELKILIANWSSQTGRIRDILGFGEPNTWNVSQVTNMDQLFNVSSARAFNEDISDWKTGKVTSMSQMFESSSFNQDISEWDVSKVENMGRMFWGNTKFNQDISDWETDSLTNMQGMFNNTPFNQPIGKWEVSNVKDMAQLFSNNHKFNQPLNGWNTSNVTSLLSMFWATNGSIFNQNISDWDVDNVKYFDRMFQDNNFFDYDLSKWKIKVGASLDYIFWNARGFSHTLNGLSWINYTGDKSRIFLNTNGASISSTLPPLPTLTLSNTNGVDSGTSSGSGKLNMTLTVSTSDYRFRQEHFKVSNGAISNFNRISDANTSYTFDFASSGTGLSSSVYILENTVYNHNIYATLNEAVSFDYTWNYTAPADPSINLLSQDVSLNDDNEFVSNKSEIKMELEIIENAAESAENEITSSTFTVSDISCVNGTVVRNSIVAESSTKFTFKVEADIIDDDIEVFMPSGKLTRVINNLSEVLSNKKSNTFIWKYKSESLTVLSLSAAQHRTGITVDRYGKTNIPDIWISVEFSETIFGFDESFITTNNCKIYRVNGSSSRYSIKLRTIVPGPASISITNDPNKKVSIGSILEKHIVSGDLTFNWEYDDTRPEVTITSSQSSGVTNNLSYIDLSFALSDVATDFDISSVTLTGDAVLSDFAGSGQDYSVRVTPTPGVSTAISVFVDDNAFTNPAGSGNSASSSFVWNYDGVTPTIEITSPDVTSGGSSSEPFIDVFFTPSKNVIDFLTLNNAVVTNGTLFSLTKVEPYADNQTSFVVTVSAKTSSHPYYDPNNITNGYVIDGVESPELTFIVGQTYTFDQSDATNSGHPIVFYDNKYKNGSQYTANVTKNGIEGTSGSTVSITIDENTPNPLYYHCGAHAYMGYRMNRSETYYGKIQPKARGDVTIVIPSDSVVDVAGNSNVVSNTFTFESTLATDIIPTLTSREVTNGGISQHEIVEIVVDVSGNVDDLTISDISCTNGTISAIESDPSGFTFDVSSNLKGVPTTLFILEDTLSTTASNIQSNVFTWTYSPLVPILTMTSSDVNEGEDTSANQIDLSLSFVNPPSPFAIENLTITNGTGTLFPETASSYSLRVVVDETYNGLVSVTLPIEEVSYNSNFNDVSYNFEWYYDTTPPVLTFPDTMPSNIASRRVQFDGTTNIPRLTLTIESNEYVTGLELSDFTATNAILSNLSSKEGTTFTFDIEPIDNKADCSINVLFDASNSLVKDRAGNSIDASDNFAYSYIYESKKKPPSELVGAFAGLGQAIPLGKINQLLSIVSSLVKDDPFSSSSTEEEVITLPIAFSDDNNGRKAFSQAIDQIFAYDEEDGGETTEIKIDKSSIPLVSTAEEKLAAVSEVKVIKSNQEEPIVIETSTTEPTATYIPLANVGDFAIITINDVEYTTNVIGDESFELSSDVTGVIGTFTSGEVYSHDAENSIIFGSQIVSNNPVIPDQPPTLTFTSSQVTSGGTSSSQSVELTITFSTTVDIQIGDVDPLNSDTNVIASSNYGDITVTVTPVDASTNSTLGVFIGANTFYDASGTYNDVSYTFSWNYSLTGSGGGGSGDIPCFLKGTQILTTKGYKNVEVLDPHKDKLLDKDNNVLELLELKSYKQENNGVHYPHKIPGGTQLSENFTCTKDLYMTYNHCIYIPNKNKYVPVSMMKRLKPEKSLPQSVFEYYHVFTANYFSDTIMANGIPCETTGKYMFKKLFSIDRNGDLFRKVLDIVNMKPNCMRDRITNKEMKNIIKKFSKSGVKMLTK